MRLCGQEFSLDLLDRIREVVTLVPEMARRALSRRVCEWLDWRTAAGGWQEGGCRKALAQLVRRQVIELPAARARFTPRQPTTLAVEDLRFSGPLEALGAVELVAVEAGSLEAQTWRALIAREHYLGEQPLCGAQLRYLVRCEAYGCPGALAFTSASWAMKARDEAMGWEDAARRHNLRQVVANARFLVRQGVLVPSLASHARGLASQRLPADWETLRRATAVSGARRRMSPKPALRAPARWRPIAFSVTAR